MRVARVRGMPTEKEPQKPIPADDAKKPAAGTTSPPHESGVKPDWKREKGGVIDARDADKFKVS